MPKRGFLFLGFLVSKSFGFFVSWFQRFVVLWLQSFKDLQNVHFMIFTDTDLRSNMLKIVLDGSSGCVGAHLFKNRENRTSEVLRFIQIICLQNHPVFFLNFFRCPGVSKDEHILFWEQGTRPKIPKS